MKLMMHGREKMKANININRLKSRQSSNHKQDIPTTQEKKTLKHSKIELLTTNKIKKFPEKSRKKNDQIQSYL